jgi:hypothetical protein
VSSIATPYPLPGVFDQGRWVRQLKGVSGAEGKKRPQWEMYDLKTDPTEKTNIAFQGYERSATEETQFQRLKRKLARIEKRRLQPLK